MLIDMYRDSRSSLAARVEALKTDLTLAQEAVAARERELSPLMCRLFPLFENFSDTTANVRGETARKRLYFCLFYGPVIVSILAFLSVVILPLALLWRNRRRDIRALRRATQKTRKISYRLEDAEQTLQELED